MVQNIFIGLGLFIALLMIMAFIQNQIQKRRGEYPEAIDSISRTGSKSLTKVVTEKKVKAWPVFDNIKTYLIHRTAYFKNRKDRAESAALITDYKKRSRVFKALAKERFRYSWSGTYYSKKLKPTT